MTAWGAEHFPGVPVAILRAAAVRLRGVGVELSPAAIREFAEQNKAFSLEPGPAISVEDLEIAVREAETERRIAEADR